VEIENSRLIHDRARAALTANTTYLALTNPTNAESAAQVKLLTREVNGLLRLLLGALQDVSDT
jgi:hypothetical protein